MPQLQELEHVAKMVHTKHDSDGSISVLMRCCDDPSTDQWHTLYVKTETSAAEVKAFVKRVRAVCEAQHGARERARAIIESGVT